MVMKPKYRPQFRSSDGSALVVAFINGDLQIAVPRVFQERWRRHFERQRNRCINDPVRRDRTRPDMVGQREIHSTFSESATIPRVGRILSLEITCLIAEGITADANSRVLAIEFDRMGLRAWNPPHRDHGRDYG